MAIHEVMTVTEDIERMVAEHASSEDIGRVALEQGMLTLRQDGMEKVRSGDDFDRRDLPGDRLTRFKFPRRMTDR